MHASKTTVTILGSGSCVPRLERSSCSILVSAPGESLLFDCGAGTTRRLLRAGAAPATIDRVFLSHYHPDHSSELVYLLFAAAYADPGGRSAG
jgi:ribonuclease BN (tRNA processing enzyme)